MNNKIKILDIKKSFFDKKIKKKNYINRIYDNWHEKLYQYTDLIGQSNLKSINITDKKLIIETKNEIKFFCIPGDKRIAPIGILNFSDYEYQETTLVCDLMQGKKCFYDVGANIGWYSLNISKKNKNASIYSFEPIKKTYEYLVKNIKLNNFQNIKAYNFGLSNKKGSFSFYFYPEGSGNASMRDLSKRDTVTKLNCKLKVMDNFRKENRHCVDFIKIDTEGSELLVLNGAKKILSEDKPIIFSEILRKWAKEFNYKANDVLIFLRNYGYNCYTIKRNKLFEINKINRKTIETNFIFLHPQKHNKEINRYILK